MGTVTIKIDNERRGIQKSYPRSLQRCHSHDVLLHEGPLF
jgi:hypothetical protein